MSTDCRSAPAARAAGVLAVLALFVGCPGSSGSASSGGAPGLFLNVLPPGSNGNSHGGTGFPGQLLPDGGGPPHFQDQLSLYGDLSYAQPDLTAAPCRPPADSTGHVASSALACNYFKTEGLVPERVESTQTRVTPTGGKVTIQRDGWGVPFVSGDTRADAMYGFGYASGEDRLWLYDLLRNLGRGQLSSFLGPASSFYSYDSNLATVAGYDEDELTRMVTDMPAKLGALGTLIVSDLDADVAGLNAYVASLTGASAANRPPEYAFLKGGGFPPPPFTTNDVVASSILIQSLLARGGGNEHENELLLQELDPQLAPGATEVSAAACALWRDLRHADDPDAARTIDAVFRQSPATLDETCPHALLAGAAVWDPGSFHTRSAFNTAPVGATPTGLDAGTTDAAPGEGGTMAAAAVRAASAVRPLYPALDPVRGARDGLRAAGFGVPDSMSSFIAVNADQTRDGHPIAVMGPQTSYLVPQLLWEVAIHSGGGTPQDFDGRGVVFANLPYIEIGRGLSYAWSATSGESDLTDVRVSKMCNLDGSPPSLQDADGDGFPDADGYLFDANDGQGARCRRFYVRTDQWTAMPTTASTSSGGPSTPETATRKIMRTHYGPVFATATVGGAPVAVSMQRSTFGAELDSSVPFALASAHVVHDATR
jgi:hypothetical protein